MKKEYALGIDLGTSNSALALGGVTSDGVEILPITQVLGPRTLGEKSVLPSAIYLSNQGEFPAEALKLPWSKDDPRDVLGEFARDHGSQVPDRLVTSAKSWLSNPNVDPKSNVLPWRSTIDSKISAFDATRRYLEHLRESYRATKPEIPLEALQVVITVPASFHELARQLTHEAAQAAGFSEPVLLEEPQAAFYAWAAATGERWSDQVAPGDIVLVCDVGGGTSDFSLIAVNESQGELALERISVGEHLLLGGDNMDLALAFTVQARLSDEGHNLDDWQFQALIHSSRRAKEKFLSDPSVKELPLAIPSRGSSLFAKTISAKIDRATVESVILDGFFPLTSVDDLPDEKALGGFQELGLPYASDPVISKQLARFLSRSLLNVQSSDELKALVSKRPEATSGSFLRPTAVLFNGGVFKADAARERVMRLLSQWSGGEGIRELPGFEPDLAVAKGACAYGKTRVTGKGVRIKAGTARSYYVGLASSMPAVPGYKPPIKALCVVPQGMEEGTELVIEDQEFGLITGQSAEFRFFSSEVRSGDEVGKVIPKAEQELEETLCLNVSLTELKGHPPGEAVPVRVNVIVTELGNLELWMKHLPSGEKWKFDLELRGD